MSLPLVLAVGSLVLVMSTAPLAAQSGTVEAYTVNDGVNDAQDIPFGEFGIDLGSAIYFSR